MRMPFYQHLNTSVRGTVFW
ncbi:hypothetical protein ACNKHU_07385 [Shigella flexneri]